MNLDLRHLKWSKANSRETPCFTADVYIDGEKVGDVHNDGGGGQDRLSPPRLADRIGAYAKTLPPMTRWERTRPREWTDLVSDAFERADARREFERRVKKHVMFVDGTGSLRFSAACKKDELGRAVEARAAEGQTVLQRLPADEAFAIYWAAVKPEGSL